MKLRCITNSIRLRLTKSDIQQLENTGIVQESLHINSQTVFSFSLQLDTNLSEIHLSFQEGKLQVSLPEARAKSWIHSNEVGIEVLPDSSSQQNIHLLIEKDFPCKDREDEDKSNTFWELSGEEGKAC